MDAILEIPMREVLEGLPLDPESKTLLLIEGRSLCFRSTISFSRSRQVCGQPLSDYVKS